MSEVRRLGTAKQACEAAGVKTPATLRSWVHQGLIHAVRVGNGPYKYDLDEVARMVVEFPGANDIDQRIRQMVADAPELSLKQINQLRLLIHAGVSAEDRGDGAA